jgi:SAM-dependent methyltransferase
MRGHAAGSTVGWDARLSTPGDPVCAPDWLALREPADAAARSADLVELLVPHLPAGPLTVRDLGCGTGSMGRWLAPRLPGPQVWVLHDRDPDLLEIAARGLPATASDGTPVTTRTERGDLADVGVADLAGTSLITASALLDLLTVDELDVLADACVAAGCPVLLTLSVTGHARLSPAEPLDSAFAAAFDDHQRRTEGGRRLLGPDAGVVAVAAFDRRGAAVLTRPSPWRLGVGEAELAEEWLRGWIAAACVHRPELADHADAYLQRRLDACTAGRLDVTVGHLDVLVLPREQR